jgi:hypothetical protein
MTDSSAIRLSSMAGGNKTQRLVQLSHERRVDSFSLIDWPEKVSRNAPWLSYDQLSVWNTGLMESLSEEQLIRLSQAECILLFSLNVHGIKELIAALVPFMYSLEEKEVTDYLHCFIDEENKHLAYFGRFCLTYCDSGIMSTKSIGGLRDAALLSKKDVKAGFFLVLLQVFIFERLGHRRNLASFRNETVEPFVRKIHEWHVQDESRHLSFGRLQLAHLGNIALEILGKEQLVRRVRSGISLTVALFADPHCFRMAGLEMRPLWLSYLKSEERRIRDKQVAEELASEIFRLIEGAGIEI